MRLVALILALFALTLPLHAEDAPAVPAPPGRTLVVATKEAPPFAMKGKDGTWSGISIDLWKRIAGQLNLDYRLVEEPTVKALIDQTAAGTYDAAVAAITITSPRARIVDFSQPFYATGLGIAVPLAAPSMWELLVHTLVSFGFLQAVGALIGLALLVGVLVWLFERNRNDHFKGAAGKGIGAGIWWSAEAMTQASTGHVAPTTMAGRAVAIVWMVVSVIALAVFTAGVTSALTTRQLQGLVNSAADLSRVRVGAVNGSATVEYLTAERIRFQGFATAQDGLKAMQDKRIDAFVYDKPLLAWIVLQQFSTSADMLDVVFDPQNYGIALPLGSPLRRDVDIALLDATHSDWWKTTLFRYLGER
ncbi:transporter substrate-binding domain-containing protein [Ancylobacter sp. 6x-1]|uniref:Transporter substrate-binding domain-containing protein n=1 Tax=Ancylobacter crimeensis TaxID=2579147 RepID=A0ABT0DDX4_9HYPH|nr:transporter substrate-binding domain-containing protein [Ancylobacter crimeensis]MCK0198153.1 transporter substrate-binding domain-containing protein [Ancylobacter crimeensis]